MDKKLKIAVVGIGLIGGSILKRLSKENCSLLAVSRSQETVEKTRKLNIADEVSTDIGIVRDADMVFVCTPISKTIATIKALSQIVRKDCIVTDVASLKGDIMDFVNNSDIPVNFIGGHPMAGTEHSGVDHAFEELFEGAKWVLTPSKWTTLEDVEKLKDIIKLMGTKPVIADPKKHDKAVSLISHMPLLLSQALFGTVKEYPDETVRELALKLAASGFRDTTRLAGTNPELAKDMLVDNRANVTDSIDELISYLLELKEKLSSDPEELVNKINEIVQPRREMYSQDGKNLY